MPRTRCRILGEPLLGRGETDLAVHNRRAFVVLAKVALVGRRQLRSDLAAQIWPDAPSRIAGANLRSVLSNLRRVAPDLLDIDRTSIALHDGARTSIDAAHFVDLAEVVVDGRRTLTERIGAARRALEAYHGELLPGAEALVDGTLLGWIEHERHVLERRHQVVLVELVDALRATGNASDAARFGFRLVAADPYREASYLALAEALLESGDGHEAMRQLDRCRNLLDDDLGVAVGPAIEELERRLRSGAAAPAGNDPATRRSVIPDLLPLPSRPLLLGRAAEIDGLTEPGAGRRALFVTLAGAGGAGKTSIAVEVAHRWRVAGRDVVFVDLTDATVADDLVEAIGRSLGLMATPTIDTVVAAVGDRELHLVVDNFEHLVEIAAHHVQTLAARCPSATLLVTSRIPLGVSGEEVVFVDGFPPLDADAPPTELMEQPAVELFVRTARRCGARLGPDPVLIGRVTELCNMVGGLPIAIELAASQVRSMGVDRIIECIDAHDISVLETEFVDVSSRHRAFPAIVRASLDLLDPPARRAFGIASIFDGPFDPAAMCRAEGSGRSEAAMRRILQQLVDLTLLRGDPGSDGRWYSLLPALRSVAATEVDAGERALAVRRRVDHDCQLVVRAAAEFQTARSRLWFRHIDRYAATLRSTLGFLHDAADAREPVVLDCLGEYWLDRGLFAEGARRLAACPPPSGTIGNSPDDPPWIASTLAMWHEVLHAEAVGYQSADVADNVVRILQDIRDHAPAQVVLAMIRLACHAFDLADRPDLASPLLEEGLELARASGSMWLDVQFRYSQAMIAHVDGDDDVAADLLRSVAVDAELHEHRRIEMYAHMLLDLVGVSGRPGGTEWTLRTLLDRAVELGDRRQVIWILVSLGAVAILEDDLPAMARWNLEALTLAENGGYFLGARYCLMAGATGAAMRGDTAVAVEFHAAVAPHLDSIGRSMPRAYFEPYLEMAGVLDAAVDDDPALDSIRRRAMLAPHRTTVRRLHDWLVTLAEP